MSETDTQRTAWNAARVNGPRPPAYDGPCCAAVGPWTFGCTRAKGHSGQHVATAGDEVAAVWAGQHGWRPATTAADAYSQAAGIAALAKETT